MDQDFNTFISKASVVSCTFLALTIHISPDAQERAKSYYLPSCQISHEKSRVTYKIRNFLCYFGRRNHFSLFPCLAMKDLTALIALHKYTWRLTPKVLLQRHFWLKCMDTNQGGKLILSQQEASWPPTIWQHHMFLFCKMIQQPPGSTRTASPCKGKWRRQKNLGCSTELWKSRSNSNIKRKPEHR